jgi:hypothetical protein
MLPVPPAFLKLRQAGAARQTGNNNRCETRNPRLAYSSWPVVGLRRFDPTIALFGAGELRLLAVSHASFRPLMWSLLQRPYDTLHNQAPSNSSDMKAIADAAPFTAAFNT